MRKVPSISGYEKGIMDRVGKFCRATGYQRPLLTGCCNLSFTCILHTREAVVIVWQLDSQLPVQSVPITTKVMSSNPGHSCPQYKTCMNPSITQLQTTQRPKWKRVNVPFRVHDAFLEKTFIKYVASHDWKPKIIQKSYFIVYMV